MAQTAVCPTCDSELPAHSPGNLCPGCLMRLGLENEVADEHADIESADARRNGASDSGDHCVGGGDAHETIIEIVDALDVGPTGTESAESTGRLVLLGEIARGGVGVVLRGHDRALGRDLAVKILQEKHCDRPAMVRRFVVEARITGQLQHPGIVPVHELGVLPDQRPFFAMKLVKGSTFAEILTESAHRPGDRPRLLAVFLQVAQTIAYAHNHCVIHLDLKPANIMVGKYGEVQVMDWGLARILAREAGSAFAADAVDSGTSSGDLAPGASPNGPFMGTPGYMAPEQFGGESELDERTDVFALGAILFEILTGRPIFDGVTSRELRTRAAKDDLQTAFQLLERCEADADLIALARDCLAPFRDLRPRHSGVVAERLTAHFEGVQERLRQAEVARAQAHARALEERKRRRLTALLAGLVLALAGLGVVTYASWRERKQDREAVADRVLREVEALRDEAAADPSGDPVRWAAAEAALSHARLTLERLDGTLQIVRVRALTGEIERARKVAQSDQELVSRAEIARWRADEGDLVDAESRFATAFRDAGLDVASADPLALGRAVAARPENLAQAIVAALDRWAIVRRENDLLWNPTGQTFRLPLDAARAADPDPWRNSLRDALAQKDGDALTRFASAADIERRPAQSLRLMGRLLIWDGQHKLAQTFLSRAWRAYPGDFWINLDLALVTAFQPENRELAFPYITAAVALRPDSAVAQMRLAITQIRRGDHAAAEAAFRAAIRIWPDYAFAHLNLAQLLAIAKRDREAADEYRASIRLNLGWAQAIRLRLGETLIRLDEPKEGSPEPTDAALRFAHWHSLGVVRIRRGDARGAAEALRRAAQSASPGTAQMAEIEDAQRQAAELERLRGIIAGNERCKGIQEAFYFAQLCENYGWLAAAAAVYSEALPKETARVLDQGPSHNFRAARYAALAGTNETQDIPPPDETGRAHLRGQALAWLRSDLSEWTRLFAPDKPETRVRAAEQLRLWKLDAALAGVRGREALAKLPAEEREAWQKFWQEVDVCLP